MSAFSRYGAMSNDEEDGDEYDMSGFLNGPAPPPEPKPKVTQRARGTSNTANPNIGYTIRNPVHEEPIESPVYYALSPFWSDDNSLGGKAPAVAKMVGMTGMVVTGTYALAARNGGGSSIANKAFVVSTAMYAHPTLGWNYGLLKPLPTGSFIERIGSGSAKALTHGLVGYGFYRWFRR